MSPIYFSLNVIYLPLSFVVFLETSPASALPHISRGYPPIHFCLLPLPSKPQMPVLQIAITFSEVIVITLIIPATVALSLMTSYSKPKYYMSQTLSLL